MATLVDENNRKTDGVEQRIAMRLRDADVGAPVAEVMRDLMAAGLDHIPLPGHGATLKRWQALERVARHDLGLVKLYEGHTDALAILQEIDVHPPSSAATLRAVWASEARAEPMTIRSVEGTRAIIGGRKSWCSGARVVDEGLMTAVDPTGKRWLVAVKLSAAGITIDETRWNAVGMRGSASFDVVCDGVDARVVGASGAYLERRGFWHGGAGIAACWFGAAASIGARVRDLQRGRDDVHALAHLGAIDATLASGAALLREAAAAIDLAPGRDAMRIALRARGAVSDVCEGVIHHAMRAIGAGPLCNEADLAQRVADLPIFIRQSRAEHDQVAQARALLADEREMRDVGWAL
ncbi:MAG: acyl-CoA dehydrogenase family protein [Burkholderiaceae bacterium]